MISYFNTAPRILAYMGWHSYSALTRYHSFLWAEVVRISAQTSKALFVSHKFLHPQSRLPKDWKVGGSNPSGGEIFRIRPDRAWGPPSVLYSGHRVFPGSKTAVVWHWPPTSSSAEVKERGELYLYSPSGFSWPVLGWTLPLPLPCSRSFLV